jgi:hypothetical protein
MVTSNPAGIGCSGDCTQYYNHNTSVTLTANSVPGYKFISWGGNCFGTSTTCTLTMNSTKAVSATFNHLVTLSPNKDAYVSNNSPDTNYGTNQNIWTANYWNFGSPTQISHGLIQFDLSPIPYAPSGSNIVSATLKLYATSVPGSGGFSLTPFTGNWGETTVTYNTLPGTGGAGASSDNISSPGWVSANVTDAVRAMRVGTNYGWLMQGTYYNNNIYTASRDYPGTGSDPYLEVVYN